MAYHIEVISVGGAFDKDIEEAAQVVNGCQKEFVFAPPPERLRAEGASQVATSYATSDLWDFLRQYRAKAGGYRPFLVALVDKELHSATTGNLFGAHEAREGLAAFTLHDHGRFVESTRLYVTYYFIRYALSFVAPDLKSHRETRGCFFDYKQRKADIVESIDSGTFCEECRTTLWKALNLEGIAAVLKMASAMKSLRAKSQESIAAELLKGQVEIGIITMREDDE